MPDNRPYNLTLHNNLKNIYRHLKRIKTLQVKNTKSSFYLITIYWKKFLVAPAKSKILLRSFAFWVTIKNFRRLFANYK